MHAVQVTVTFFLSQRSFDAVRLRYGSFTYRINLRQKVELVENGDGAVRAAGGDPVPPFLVTARYRSLPQWAAAEGAHATTVAMAQVGLNFKMYLNNVTCAIVRPSWH